MTVTLTFSFSFHGQITAHNVKKRWSGCHEMMENENNAAAWTMEFHSLIVPQHVSSDRMKVVPPLTSLRSPRWKRYDFLGVSTHKYEERERMREPRSQTFGFPHSSSLLLYLCVCVWTGKWRRSLSPSLFTHTFFLFFFLLFSPTEY